MAALFIVHLDSFSQVVFPLLDLAMASGHLFLTLPDVPPLDITMQDPMFEQHDNDSATKKDTRSPTPRQSLNPTPSLRKSVSVDSFAQYGRDSPILAGPRQNRGNTG